MLGSGGSAFVDGGIGALHAMKIFKFHLKDGHILEENEIPTVKNADQIDKLTLNESAIPMI